MNCEFATVSIFSHAAIASLNNLEIMVYHYVIKNRDKVMYMTIRELAEVPESPRLPFCASAASCSAKATRSFAYALNYIWSRMSLNRQISAPAK